MTQWIYALDLIGTLVFAVSGVLAGIDKKFDLLGAAILGLVTAVGGGTLRDMMIGQTPVGWMTDLNYLWVILLSLPLCYRFKRHILRLRRSLFLFDTIGLGLFTVLGLLKTLDTGLSPVIAVLMGAVSASFGGVIRDVLSNEVPLIFRREIYASACLAGGIAFLLLEALLPYRLFNTLTAMVVVMAIRYLAVRYHWSLAVEARH